MGDLHEKYDNIVDTYAMGDSPQLADELLSLVLSGKKTASCDALRFYEQELIPLPEVGDRYILLDGAGRQAALIEIIETFQRRFDEIDEDFARQEGEGDLSLASWQEGHKTYFERNGGFSPNMMLVCERFCVIEAPDRDDERDSEQD